MADEIRIITFPSVWHAFRAEKILKAAGVPCDLIPVPRELSSSCQGLAAKITDSVLDKALELLGKHLGIFSDKLEVSGKVDIAKAIEDGRKRANSKE